VQIGSFLTGKLLSRFGFKAAFYMHAAFSLPTLLILLRFSPKKEDRSGKGPPKFAELYRLVVHDPDVLVSRGHQLDLIITRAIQVSRRSLNKFCRFWFRLRWCC